MTNGRPFRTWKGPPGKTQKTQVFVSVFLLLKNMDATVPDGAQQRPYAESRCALGVDGVLGVVGSRHVNMSPDHVVPDELLKEDGGIDGSPFAGAGIHHVGARTLESGKSRGRPQR